MADGNTVVNDWIRQLRTTSEVAAAAAPEVADVVEASIVASASASTTPMGEAWQPTKAGTKPLQRVRAELQKTTIGSVILFKLLGHYAKHNNGWVKGGVKRQILPKEDLPQSLKTSVEAVISKRLKEHFDG